MKSPTGLYGSKVAQPREVEQSKDGAQPQRIGPQKFSSFSATKIVVISFLCLIASQLTINTFFPSLAINVVGIVLVTLILAWVLFQKNDLFSYLLIIFFCSQFQIALNQGGLFNLITFLLLSVYILKNKVRENGVSSDMAITGPLVVLFIANTLGLIIRNPMPPFVKGLEFGAFTGILLAFHSASTLRMTAKRIRTFLHVVGIMVIYDLGLSLNQHYAVLMLNTPLLGLTDKLFYAARNAFGTFGSASMNGQFNMMVLALLLPPICASVSRQKLNLSPLFFGLVCVACGLLLVLANMRAAALESVIMVVIYMIMFSMIYRRSFKYSKYLTRSAAVVLVVLMYFGTTVGLQYISADLEAVSVRTSADLTSGKALNRLGPWQTGLQILSERSWILGYGHGVPESNQLAWGGERLTTGIVIGGGHFHNLYLALPTLYGWTGATAYLYLLFTVVFRLFRSVRRYSFDNLLVVLSLGFLMSLGLYLLDEFKSGHAVQDFNLPMIIFIWFGLGLATVRTIRAELLDLRRAKQAEPPRDPASDS